MPDQAMQSAIALIREEHRSLAAVIGAMEQQLDLAEVGHRLPDFRLLRTALYYIETFTEALHHPKEEVYLFRLLRERTHKLDGDLTRLQHEHLEEAQMLYEMLRALKRYETYTEDGPAAFAHILQRFATLARRHMRFEEDVILPAAARHLDARDWQDIDQAFGKNGDPRLGTASAENFNEVLAEIRHRPSAVGGGLIGTLHSREGAGRC